MNITKLFLSAVLATLIIGCAPRQYVPTPTEVRRNYDVATVNTAQRNYSSCVESLKNKQVDPKIAAAIEIVDKQIYFEKDDSPNKLELMSSTAKLNDKQRIALLEVVGAAQKCRAGILADLKSFPSLAITYENFFGDMDIVHAQLLSKKITIGDANTQKAQITSRAKSAYATAITNLDSQYNSAISREMEARQAEDRQRRALAAQYLMNQQLINQQTIQNQLNNNNRTINTNCTRIGNQVNCTSN